ncbi:tyrosine-type recombinase/integrase [Actinoplanes auranticolor]
MALRDEALIRLYYNTGARLSEIGNLLLTDLDMNAESVHLHGKGSQRPSGAVRPEDVPGDRPVAASPSEA